MNPKTTLFRHIYILKNHTAWVTPLGPHLFKPSEGPKGFKIVVFIYHGSVTMGKGHMAWDNFVICDVNNP